MSLIGRLSSSSSQNFACSRRELPGKLFAIGAALLLPERRGEVSVTQTEVQPKFKVGDLIASDWVDEFGKSFVDFGEILGLRYFAKGQSSFAANTWVYYVNWTHSTCGLDYLYPCYDQEASRECDLRLVKQS
jgi:hypothetical protein